MEKAYDGRQVVGMDLHRRRSVLVRMTDDGRRLGTVRITNSPAELRAQIARAGKNPWVLGRDPLCSWQYASTASWDAVIGLPPHQSARTWRAARPR